MRSQNEREQVVPLGVVVGADGAWLESVNAEDARQDKVAKPVALVAVSPDMPAKAVVTPIGVAAKKRKAPKLLLLAT